MAFMFKVIPGHRWAAVCLLVTGLLASARAFAEDDPEALIKQGVALRQRGEDVKAHGYFQRAYDLSHTPRSAAQLGLANMALASWLQAESCLSEALAARDPWIESQKKTLEKSRAQVRLHLGAVQIEGAPTSAVFEADDRTATRIPDGGTIWFNPGAVRLTVSAPGFQSSSRELAVSAGATSKVQFTLAPNPPKVVVADALPRPERLGAGSGPASGATGGPGTIEIAHAGEVDGHAQRRRVRIASIAVGAVGVGAIAGGFILRGIASNKIDAINADGKAGHLSNPANFNYQTFDRLGVGALVGGAVAAAAGIVGFIVSRDPASGESTAAIQPGPGDAGLTIAGRF